MPVAWRIVKTKYSASPFDGEGARLYGGRWTSAGNSAVYTADSAALAILEVLVHLGSPSTLAHYSLVSAEFSVASVTTIAVSDLPGNWRESPAPPALQQLGDQWLADAQFAVLQVPSAVVEQHSNYLINPRHPDFRAFTLGRPIPYAFDSRLLKR